MAVDGRAKVVDDFGDGGADDGDPLDGLLFTRLAADGRRCDHGAIAYGGDEAVGRRIVDT